MKLSVVHQSASETQSKEWQAFTKLWHKIEKAEQRNQRYELKLSKFCTYFKHEVLSSEREICDITAELITHLIGFVPRKTIKGAKHEELLRWIEEELQTLESNPFQAHDTVAMRQELTHAIKSSLPPPPDVEPDEVDIERFRDMLEDMFGDDINVTDEQIKASILDHDVAQSLLEQLVQQSRVRSEQCWEGDDEETQFAWDEDDSGESFHHQKNEVPSEVVAQLFSRSGLNKLYKRLASLFHPDKERDPTRRQEKKSLMQVLSKAKKEGDAFTLLSLSQKWLPDVELNLDASSMDALVVVLNGRLSCIDRDYNEMKMGDAIESTVWRRFGGGNKKERERTIEKYRYSLQSEVEDLRGVIAQVRTVKAMNEALKARLERHNSLSAIDLIQQLAMNEEFVDFFDKEFDGFAPF
ncbi:hypothetical protein [Thaumasiovibrio sp. DFM-14]|uniref:hypothetical protein n=1 Tax=Thaumasiovibrio sp. DFM-14 TaxID=3384792 RepID=UPI0039A1B9BB